MEYLGSIDDFLAAFAALTVEPLGVGRRLSHKMKAFRIEMPNGKGPYNSDLPEAKKIYNHICAPREGFDCSHLARENCEQCGITEANFEQAHGAAMYGCNSIEAIKNWFPQPAREYLAEYGAKLIEYEIPVGDYVLSVGNGEIIFNTFTAIRVKELDVIECS